MENNELNLTWDFQGMLDRIGGDKDIAMAVLDGFINTIPEQVNALEDFIKKKNLNGVSHVAHSLKGVAATVGGEKLRSVCYDMELAGRSASIAQASNLMPSLRREFNALVDTIKSSDFYIKE